MKKVDLLLHNCEVVFPISFTAKNNIYVDNIMNIDVVIDTILMFASVSLKLDNLIFGNIIWIIEIILQATISSKAMLFNKFKFPCSSFMYCENPNDGLCVTAII